MNTPIENLRLPRTGKSTLYEVMSAAILLLAWIAGIVATINHKTSGRIVILLIVFSVVVALMHYCSYRPAMPWARNSFQPTTVRQAMVASRYYRVFAIEMALFCLIIILFDLLDMRDSLPSRASGFVFFVFLMITYNSASRKLMRVRNAEREQRQQNGHGK